MHSYLPIRSIMIPAILVVLSLLLGGCADAPTTPDPTLAEKTPASIESDGITPTASTPVVEIQPPTRPISTIDSGQLFTPDVLDLILHKQGFGQNGRQLAYGFEIENPNNRAVSDNVLQILAYDEDGRLLGSDEENFPLLLPGQRLGIAGSLQLENDSPITQLSLQMTIGDSLELELLPKLEVISVNYRSSEIYNRVTGLIANEGETELEDIRISAIAYSNDDRIVGAGYAFLSFLPAGSETGIDIVLTATESIDHVQLFPRVSLPTLSSSSQDRLPFSSEPDILDFGFSQEGIEVGYGFLVTNPNQFHALENTEYRVTFFNDQNGVVAVDEGFIDLLVPEQIFGIGDHVFVDEGESVDQMTVLARPSKYRPAISEPILTAEDVAVITGTLGTFITGQIINPYETGLENLRVSAVVYNNDGLIIGGGYDWIDQLPPAGMVPVEVWVTAPGEPVSAELYTGIAEILRR